jgi:hypothetical protein
MFMRKAEIIIASFLILIGCVTTAEAFRLGIGYEIWGPQAGFIIFWLSMLTIVTAGAILLRGVRMKKAEAFFLSVPAMWSAGYVALTSLIFCGLIPLVGTYFSMFIYAGLFSAWLGKARWYSALALAILMPLALYFGFEKGLMVPLIKSPIYGNPMPVLGWFPF